MGTNEWEWQNKIYLLNLGIFEDNKGAINNYAEIASLTQDHLRQSGPMIMWHINIQIPSPISQILKIGSNSIDTWKDVQQH